MDCVVVKQHTVTADICQQFFLVLAIEIFQNDFVPVFLKLRRDPGFVVGCNQLHADPEHFPYFNQQFIFAAAEENVVKLGVREAAFINGMICGAIGELFRILL